MIFLDLLNLLLSYRFHDNNNNNNNNNNTTLFKSPQKTYLQIFTHFTIVY